MEDSKEYLAKKAFFDKVLTIYGRNAVIEALEDNAITIHKLHLSKSNKDAEILEEMKSIAARRGIEVKYHDKQSLSRISKNAKQDQGVALDIVLEHFGDEESFKSENKSYRVIALDGVTNPQNLGMIIRSATAGNIDAILLPGKGAAQISPLPVFCIYPIPDSTSKTFDNKTSRSSYLSIKASLNFVRFAFGQEGVNLFKISNYSL